MYCKYVDVPASKVDHPVARETAVRHLLLTNHSLAKHICIYLSWHFMYPAYKKIL